MQEMWTYFLLGRSSLRFFWKQSLDLIESFGGNLRQVRFGGSGSTYQQHDETGNEACFEERRGRTTETRSEGPTTLTLIPLLKVPQTLPPYLNFPKMTRVPLFLYFCRTHRWNLLGFLIEECNKLVLSQTTTVRLNYRTNSIGYAWHRPPHCRSYP